MALDRDTFNRQSLGPSLNANVKQVCISHFLATPFTGIAFVASLLPLLQTIKKFSHRAPSIANSFSEP
jgi:hypothetical protein